MEIKAAQICTGGRNSRGGRCTVIPGGPISPDQMKVFGNYGVDLHPNILKKGPHTSGGHPNLRTAINLG